jgi:hypothetical protein
MTRAPLAPVQIPARRRSDHQVTLTGDAARLLRLRAAGLGIDPQALAERIIHQAIGRAPSC